MIELINIKWSRNQSHGERVIVKNTRTGNVRYFIRYLMSRTLKNLSNWTSTLGRTTQSSLLEFQWSHRRWCRTAPITRSKCIGVILDIQEEVTQSTVVGVKAGTYGACKQAIVRLIRTYGCLVWWEAMKNNVCIRLMVKVQRIESVLITGGS